MRNGKSAIPALLVGVIAFGNVARQPRFETFHIVDVITLLASGMCFGVVLAALLDRRRAKRET